MRTPARMLRSLLLLAVLLAAVSCNKGSQQAATDTNTPPAQEVAQVPPVRDTTGGNVPPTKSPEAAPDFSYTAFDGTSGKLSTLAGKPTVVNLWAVW